MVIKGDQKHKPFIIHIQMLLMNHKPTVLLLMNRKATVLLLITIVLILPLLAVHIIQKEDPTLYTFKAQIIEPLESPYTVYEYFRVKAVEGTYPDSDIILVINMILTEGSHIPEPTHEPWIQGRLLPENFLCEKHYSFPHYTHVYALQVKDGIFWPDQIIKLKKIYQSPVTTLPTPSFMWFYLFIENPLIHTPKMSFILIGRTVLVYAALFLVIKNRTKGWNIFIVLLVYALFAMISTVYELIY